MLDWIKSIPKEQVSITDSEEAYAAALVQISDTSSIPATSPVALGLAMTPSIKVGNHAYRLRPNPLPNRALYDPIQGSDYSVIVAKIEGNEVLVFVGLTEMIDY